MLGFDWDNVKSCRIDIYFFLIIFIDIIEFFLKYLVEFTNGAICAWSFLCRKIFFLSWIFPFITSSLWGMWRSSTDFAMSPGKKCWKPEGESFMLPNILKVGSCRDKNKNNNRKNHTPKPSKPRNFVWWKSISGNEKEKTLPLNA